MNFRQWWNKWHEAREQQSTIAVHQHTIKRLPGETDEQLKRRCAGIVCALNDVRYGLKDQPK